MKKETVKTRSWINSISAPNRKFIVLLTVVSVVSACLGVSCAWILRRLIDSAVAGDMQGFSAFAVIFCVVIGAQVALGALNRYLSELTRSTLENTFKSRLFSCLLKKDYASVTSVHSGEWMNRLTSDTQVVSDGLTTIVPGLVSMLARIAASVALILVMVPQLAVILIPGAAVLILFSYVFRKKLKSLHKNIQEADGNLRVSMTEKLSSLIVVHSFSKESETLEEAQCGMEQHKKSRMKRNAFSNLCNVGFALVMNGVYILGAIMCGYGILYGFLSYGTFVAVITLVGQVQSPLANITGFVPKYYSMTASAERLMEAEEFSDDIEGSARSQCEISDYYRDEFRSLCLDGIDFTYSPPVRDDERVMPVVIKNFSMDIKKGEFVVLTGPSGSGKSTVLKLMMSLYHPDSGNMSLHGKTGDSVLDSSWRGLFAYVPQGNRLVRGTIRDIVSFGDRNADTHDIKRALDIACASSFVSKLDDGIDTLLGERGAGLSEGQMQRISVARAVYSDKPLLLLDESTSALDEKTEAQLLQNLMTMTDKTVIIVTHRKAALDVCDREVCVSEVQI